MEKGGPENDADNNSNKPNKRKRNASAVDPTSNSDNSPDLFKRVVRGKKNTVLGEYLDAVGSLMYPNPLLGPFGYSTKERRFPVSQITALGFLLHPLRKTTVAEKWSPYEIALFESSLALYGKNFHVVQKHIKTKTVKEIIEFYYEWKKTHNYREWKSIYVPDERDTPVTISN